MDPEPDKSQGGQSSGDQRLPSFKGPRDLKLSVPRSRVAVPGRRTFTPNIPSRDRSGGSSNSGGGSGSGSGGGSGSGSGPGHSNDGADGSKRGRFKQNSRGRGRGDGPRQMIQSESSIFADGVGANVAGRYRAPTASASSGSSRKLQNLVGSAQGGPLKKADFKNVLKQESASKNFISDLQQAEEEDYVAPVSIPLCTYLNGEGNATKELEMDKISEELQSIGLTSKSFAQLISSSPSEGSIILLQIPEHLPLLMDKEESPDSPNPTPSNEPAVLSTGLSHFPEGLLGKTQLLASGESRLVIGNNHFTVDIGTQPPFYQELILATEDSFLSLGPVHHKYLCTSEVDSFLNQVT